MFSLAKKDYIVGIIAVIMLITYPYFIGLLGLEPEARWLPFILGTIIGAIFYLPKHCKEMQITNK